MGAGTADELAEADVDAEADADAEPDDGVGELLPTTAMMMPNAMQKSMPNPIKVRHPPHPLDLGALNLAWQFGHFSA